MKTCCCQGKYPNFKTHTPKECYTNFGETPWPRTPETKGERNEAEKISLYDNVSGWPEINRTKGEWEEELGIDKNTLRKTVNVEKLRAVVRSLLESERENYRTRLENMLDDGRPLGELIKEELIKK